VTEIRFDGRVAIVTGAGGGLGRAHALLLASRGAKLVVNDLGGARDGTGAPSSEMANRVVEEIKAAGGEAVADAHGVDTAEGNYESGKTGHQQPPQPTRLKPAPGATVYVGKVALPRPAFVEKLTLRYTASGGKLSIIGLSLIDGRTGAAVRRAAMKASRDFWTVSSTA